MDQSDDNKSPWTENTLANSSEDPIGRNSRKSNSKDGQQPIVFNGNAKEYFGIWVVNVLLTIITLGIYGGWAKVRRITYFHNNTQIGEHILSYHATGWQITMGRAIALAVIAVLNLPYFFANKLGIPSIAVEILYYVCFFFATPLAINAALKFRARMTSHRNIRFNWHGSYKETMYKMVLGPLIGLATLGILFPWMMKRYYSYFADSHSYGATRFHANPSLLSFNLTFFVMTVPLFLLMMLVPALLWTFVISNGSGLEFLILGTVLIVLMVRSFYSTICRNLLLRSTKLGEVVEFGSTANPLKVVWIGISNIFIVIFTLGLMFPWAQVRIYKYLTNATTLAIKMNLKGEYFEAGSSRAHSASIFVMGRRVTITVEREVLCRDAIVAQVDNNRYLHLKNGAMFAFAEPIPPEILVKCKLRLTLLSRVACLQSGPSDFNRWPKSWHIPMKFLQLPKSISMRPNSSVRTPWRFPEDRSWSRTNLLNCWKMMISSCRWWRTSSHISRSVTHSRRYLRFLARS